MFSRLFPTLKEEDTVTHRLPNFNIKDVTTHRRWYHEAVRSRSNLLITVGDSWTWGDHLGAIDWEKVIDDPIRLNQTFGNQLSHDLDADWVLMANPGCSNYWMLDMLTRLKTDLVNLKSRYKHVYLVVTLTEDLRECSDSSGDVYTANYIDLFNQSSGLEEFLKAVEAQLFKKFKSLFEELNFSNTVITRAFTDVWPENVNFLQGYLLNRTWCDVFQDHVKFDRYQKVVPYIGQLAIKPLSDKFLSTLTGEKELRFKQEFLNIDQRIVTRWNFLGESQYNLKGSTYHPTADGHKLYSDYLRQQLVTIEMFYTHSDRLMQYSQILADWAKNNQVFLLDFDECMWSLRPEDNNDYSRNNKDKVSQLLFVLFDKLAKTYNYVAICESHPFFNDSDELYQLRSSQIQKAIEQAGLKYFTLTSEYSLWSTDNKSNRTFWPAWYFRQKFWAKQNSYQSYEFPKERPYTFSCCNMSNYRSEKIYNYIECARRKRTDWYLTLYNHPNARISDKDIKDIGSITAEQQEFWNTEIKNNIPDYQYDLLNQEYVNPHSTIFLGHTGAYCNLVMEHTMEVECLSEKSFKPFIAEQIPVYAASRGAVQAIAMLGFDVFYDFVDHNKYDLVCVDDSRNSLNFTQRLDALHWAIDQVYKTDIQSFIHRPDVLERKRKNKEHFYSDAIDLMTVEHLNQMLDYLAKR